QARLAAAKGSPLARQGMKRQGMTSGTRGTRPRDQAKGPGQGTRPGDQAKGPGQGTSAGDQRGNQAREPLGMALLEVIGLERSFYGVHALCGVDLKVEALRITGLIGPNGAGKTTLFNCITGVVPPDRGRILLAGRDIAGLRPDEVSARGLVRTFQI